MTTMGRAVIAIFALLPLQAAATLLDGFDDPAPWRTVASDQVDARIRVAPGAAGQALCLDYDFNGVSGHAGMRRELPLQFAANYRFDFQLRADSPSNALQFKLVDASGDNVWWVNRPRYAFPDTWTPVRYRQRQIGKAWGPGSDPVLRESAAIELVIYNDVGGKGSVCFDQLTLTVLPAADTSPLDARAATSSAKSRAARIVDGDQTNAWRSGVGAQRVTLDLGSVREFGGLTLRWAAGDHATRYAISLSDDGSRWRPVREVLDANGGIDWIALPESQARYLALDLTQSATARFALAEATVMPLSFAATPNAFVAGVARDLPRGWLPRAFQREQPYWTIAGIDGGREQGLIGEDGAIEVGRGGFSIEPFIIVDGALLSWADVATSQSLADGYLPIPAANWAHPHAALDVTTFAAGTADDSQLFARYRLRNPDAATHDYTLALALRPLQVNPPSQFLNTTGGVSRIEDLAFDNGIAIVNGVPRVFPLEPPDATFVTAFDAGLDVSVLHSGVLPKRQSVRDATGLASGAMLYRVRLAPGATLPIDLLVPLTGERPDTTIPALADTAQAATATLWREQLGRVRIGVPPAGQPLADTIRTALAHMLISRRGPRLQPGTRSYARAWIRDGAMIAEGLLRLGREDVAREFIEWYAPYQFANGKVPCCVDDRGSDPVAENDSQGELIFTIAEIYRYTGDRDFIEAMWPHVQGAFDYMEALRASERTAAIRSSNPAFYGMMPASISHEGYSAKPMHSYWDNFWSLRGYKDAVEMARALGKQDAARTITAARDQFQTDLYASIDAAVALHRIEHIPGAAELGDFDPTSLSIALAPGGEQARLPQALLLASYERYWREFQQRRDGTREWKDYTPYEWRNVSAMVRLGWRDRAWEAVRFFFDDRAPPAWNQWAEVVSRTPRTPFFVGDLPHAWVASDFVRAALDLFAYSRDHDQSLVLAAGIPADWLPHGIGITGLRTRWGPLAYRLRSADGRLRLDIDSRLVVPPGGLILPWPLAGSSPGRTTINGRPAQWRDGELHIDRLPARVEAAIAGE